MSWTKSLSVGLICMAALVVGCGGPVQSSVSGKVTVGGQAVTNARINFIAAKSALAASAELDASGAYKIEQGLPPGPYKVFVTDASSTSKPPTPGETVEAAKSQIPDKYKSDATSPLNFEVKAGENKDANFTLE